MRYRWAVISIAVILAVQTYLLAAYPSALLLACLVFTALMFVIVFAVGWRSR